MVARITHVAIRKNGIVYSLPAPNRHHHILWVLAKKKGLPDVPEVKDEHLLVETSEPGSDSQGFLDADGRYMDRHGAEIRAKQTNQIKGGQIIGGVLTSEDLW